MSLRSGVPPQQDATRIVGRLRGVDVARALALLGMMSVHLLPELDADGGTTPAFVVSAGRSSALFAVLAGVGLALATGGERPRLRPWAGTAAAVLTRALLVALIGLLLVALDPPVAVILTNYGLLFAVALPFLSLRPRQLLATAAAWVVLAPLLSHRLRQALPVGPGDQPSFAGLTDPSGFFERLAITGYYPVLTWTAYLLVGLAVGRMALRSPQTASGLMSGGAALAVLAAGLSRLVLAVGGWQHLQQAGPAQALSGVEGLGELQLHGRFGTTPTTSWWWEVVASPHSGTPFDLAQTIGSALAVLGLALLVTQRLARSSSRGPALLGRGVVAALAATGSMTLTLYSLHVIATTLDVGPRDRHQLLLIHVVVAVLLASMWRSAGARGPLEQLVSSASTSARRAVVPPAPTEPPRRDHVK